MTRRPREGARMVQGLALLAGLLGIAVLILNLGGLLSGRARRFVVVGLIPEAVALQAGGRVLVAGKDVGTISRVQVYPPGSPVGALLVVEMKLDTVVRPLVRADSRLEVTRSRLLGPPILEITPGSATAPPLEPGDTLRQRVSRTTEQVQAEASRLRTGLDRLARTSMPILREAAERRPALAALEADVRELQAALDRAAAEPMGPRLEAEARRWRAALAAARAAFEELGIRYRALAGPAAPGHGRLADVQGAIAVLEGIDASPDGLPARLARDPAIRNALDRARAQLDSLLAEARRDPTILLR